MESQVAPICGMISSYETKIQDMDTEKSRLAQFISDMKNRISLAQQKVDTLCQERQRISDAKIKWKQLLHPIRQFPAEILLRIFRSTIDFPHFVPYEVTAGTFIPLKSLFGRLRWYESSGGQ